MSQTRICVVCGRTFIPERRSSSKPPQRFCSQACAGVAKRSTLKKICAFCGKKFKPLRGRFKIQKYCSQECYHASRKGNSRIAAHLTDIAKKYWANPEARKERSRQMKNMWKQRRFKKKSLDTISKSEAEELFARFKKSGLPITKFAKEIHHKPEWLRKLFLKFFPGEYDHIIEGRAVDVNKLYRLGRRFEYRTRDFLRERHYFVLRSPRSLGPVDLVALKKGQILLIQCKTGGLMLKREKEGLVRLANSIGGIPILAYRRRHQRGVVLENLETGLPFKEFMGR